MSTTTTTATTFLLLPTEILHRIFDDLDTKTILLSVQITCKRLRSAVSTYNRFELKQISRQDLASVCQNIMPKNVRSLKVTYVGTQSTTNDFVSFIGNLPQFTGLHILSLNVRNNMELHLLLDYLSTGRITELNINVFEIFKSRPIEICTSQRLSLSGISGNNAMQTSDTLFIPMLHSNFTNLTLECSNISTDDLEVLLSCMLSLVRLNLSATVPKRNPLFDGLFLEKLISNKLPRLEHFKFYFMTKLENYDQVEQTIIPFRSSFWCEEKKWFVSCTRYTCFPRLRLILQSPPVEIDCFNNLDLDEDFSLFTIPVSVHGRVIFDNVRKISLVLSDLIRTAHETKVESKLRFLQSDYISYSRLIIQITITLINQSVFCLRLMTHGRMSGFRLFHLSWSLNIFKFFR